MCASTCADAVTKLRFCRCFLTKPRFIANLLPLLPLLIYGSANGGTILGKPHAMCKGVASWLRPWVPATLLVLHYCSLLILANLWAQGRKLPLCSRVPT